MPHSFSFHYKGSSNNNIDWETEMRISGDPATIGRMLAEFAAHEFKQGKPEALVVILTMKENLERLLPGVFDKKGQGPGSLLVSGS